MHTKIKTLVLGGLLAGSLILSAAPAMARDYHYDRDHRWDVRDWRGHDRWDNRWDHRNTGWNGYGYGYGRGSAGDWDALRQARDKAVYDANHGASRKKIAQDNAVVDQMLNRMGYPAGYDPYNGR